MKRADARVYDDYTEVNILTTHQLDHKSSENNLIKFNFFKKKNPPRIKMTATASSREKMNASLNDLMRCLPSHGFSLDETPASVFSQGDVGVCDQFSEASGGKKILGCLQ